MRTTRAKTSATTSYTIRCSGLPCFMSCASSIIPADNPVHETDTDPQNIGNAVHELMRLHTEGLTVTEADIEYVCTRERADKVEVAMRYAYGAQAWDGTEGKPGLKSYFDRVGAEEPFSRTMLLRVGGARASLTLTGHPYIGGSDVTLDWKGGRVYTNPEWQLHGYNWAMRRQWGIAVWLMDRRCDVQRAMPRKDFEAAMAAQLALVGKEYNPGEHCGFCPRRDECEARQKRMKVVYELLAGTDGILTNAADLARAFPLKRQLASYLKAYDDALGEYLQEHGSLPLGDGTEVYIREDTPREVDVQKAWPVLSEALTVEQLAMCVKLSVTSIDAAVKQVVRDEYEAKGEAVPKGELGKAVSVVWKELDAAGAVSKGSRKTKATRKVTTNA